MYFDTINGIINNLCQLNSDLMTLTDVLSDVKKLPFEVMLFRQYNLKIGYLSFSQYTTKKKVSERYENHRDYCDLHILVHGEELFYYSHLTGRIQDNYNCQRDISLLKNSYSNEKFVKLYEGVGILVTPWDAHMLRISVMQSQKAYCVKKLVIKIPWDGITEEAETLGTEAL